MHRLVKTSSRPTGGALNFADTLPFDLASNNNPFGASPNALRAARAQLHHVNEYRFQNDDILRTCLIKNFQNCLQPDQIITGNGSTEILDLICRAFLSPGDECITCTPAWRRYRDSANLAGAAALEVPLDPMEFAPDTDGILRAVTERTRLIFLASPNNPTGTVISRLRMDRLIAALPPQVIVVFDEVFHHYNVRLDSARALDYILLGFPVIALHTFSAAYGLAGLRLGYAFSTPGLTRNLQKLRRPFMINSISHAAAIAALDDMDHLKRGIRAVIRERNWLCNSLADLGLRFVNSQANFILIHSPQPTAILADQLLKKGIIVRLGEPFGANGYIRVSVGKRMANKAFIAAMNGILRPPPARL
ncbi:MAG: histidinol-phosphate transaminase [Bacteroidota bacterium]|nr:histidinol-phosphate transaminase [Bacteroidota bacterium]